MSNIVAVTGHTVLGAIEERRVDRVVHVFVPGPVGLVTIVATLVAQSGLIGPGEQPVPGEEVTLHPISWERINLGEAGRLTVP